MSRFDIHTIPSRQCQRGLNLIEVMVSMVIGLFLVLGATTLYVKSKKSSDVDDSVARVQETARYAMSAIEADIRMANYWVFKKSLGNGNSYNPDYAPTLVPSVSRDICGANYSADVAFPVAANNNGYALTCAASPAAAAPSSDTLTIRRANSTSSSSSASKLQVCANPSTSFIVYNGEPADKFPCQETHDLIVDAFYVDQGSDQSATLPSLRRKTLTSGPSFTDTEVISGVEDMQVQLGWSGDATTTNPVEFLQPGTAGPGAGGANPGQIVAVRVWLLVRSETQDFSYTDTNTYSYGDRDTVNGTVNSLSSAGAANKAYAPNDNYRRVLVSRTYFLRNTGT